MSGGHEVVWGIDVLEYAGVGAGHFDEKMAVGLDKRNRPGIAREGAERGPQGAAEADRVAAASLKIGRRHNGPGAQLRRDGLHRFRADVGHVGEGHEPTRGTAGDAYAEGKARPKPVVGIWTAYDLEARAAQFSGERQIVRSDDSHGPVDGLA